MSTEKQNVLVVGGGGAGTKVFQGLSKRLDHSRYELILITPRAHNIFYPAMVRAVVTAEGGLDSKQTGAFVPYGSCPI
jgi:NADH dehydrogenase FAD-containing subunit